MKVLITKNNSQWGARANQFKGNTYQHVINFPDKTKKDEFINSHFFGSKTYDYKNTFSNLPDIARININDINISFSINQEYYENDSLNFSKTEMELMQSDTAIVYDGSKYYFYIIKFVGKTSNNSLSFTGEIDLFFTYANEINFTGESWIKRKHIDRMNVDYSFKFDDMYMVEQSVDSKPNFKQTFKINDKVPKNSHEGEINWLVIYWKDIDTSKYVKINGQQLPYEIFIFPFNVGDSARSFSVNTSEGKDNFDGKKAIDLLVDDRCLAAHVLPYFPIKSDKFILSIGTSGINYFPARNVRKQGCEINEWENDHEYFIRLWEIENNNGIVKLTSNIGDASLNQKTPDIVNKRDIYFESKMRTKQFLELEILNSLGHSEVYDWTKITDVEINLYYSFQPEKFDLSLFFNEQGQQNSLLFRGTKFNIPVEWPIGTSKYSEYINQAKISSISGVARDVISPLVGAGIGASSDKKGGGLLGGLLGSVFGFNEIIKQQDLKNAPDTYRAPSSPLIRSFLNNENNNYFFSSLNSFWKDQQLSIYDGLYKFGYSYEKIEKITDEVMNSRYYFNFVQADNTYECLNNSLNLSTRQKELIDISFKEGITIWHYRDENTWKGILNYEFENLEMELI